MLMSKCIVDIYEARNMGQSVRIELTKNSLSAYSIQDALEYMYYFFFFINIYNWNSNFEFIK